jgi:hypothetical protein
MPVVNVSSKADWSSGTPTVRKREADLINYLGERMPDLVSEVLAYHKIAYLDPAHVVVTFGSIGPKSINAPELWVSIQMTKKWRKHRKQIKKSLARKINTIMSVWLADTEGKRYMEPLRRPSFDIELIFLKWCGSSYNSDGKKVASW